jgi:hypothetical protein
VIWSLSSRWVLIIELTCPAEENIAAANVRKEARYAPLAERCRTAGWSVRVLTIEAGARGFVARSMNTCLRKLGASPQRASKICKQISTIVARTSFDIYLSRESSVWRKRALLVPTEGVRTPNCGTERGTGNNSV